MRWHTSFVAEVPRADIGRCKTVSQIHGRVVVQLAQFRCYGEFRNWFVPNEKAVEAALYSSRFEPQRLAAWDERVRGRWRELGLEGEAPAIGEFHPEG